MTPDKRVLDELRIHRETPSERAGFRWWLVLLLLLGVVAVAAGYWWWWRPGARVQVRTIVVQGRTGGTGSATVLNASGYVTPRRESTVSSKVTGKVVEVMIEEGMRVEEGQVLARLDDVNLKASLALAEAQEASARSAQAETRVRLDEAQRELRRILGLATDKIASESDRDRAQAQVDSLQARLELQQNEIAVAARQVSVWKQQIEDTIIRAPFSGVVVAKNAQPGEMISPMSAGGGFTRTGICTIVDMDSLEIEVDVNESYLNRVEAGQNVEATLDSYPDWKIPSKVIAIIPTADRQKSTVKVRVGFEKLDPRMLPQMGVKVAFRGGAENAAALSREVTMPKSAVRSEGEQDLVWVVQGGRAERRAVRLGPARGDEVPVLAGLAEGERVIVSGAELLKDGTRVREAVGDR